jgi:[pyruvate, water dikinase]-phosphate phosphotransferase / [pyruvate, water dikinase] kinase
MSSTPLTVYIISDSSGDTAEAVTKAVLVQFPAESTYLNRLPQVRSTAQLQKMIADLSPEGGLIAYTLVLPEYRNTLEAEASKFQIPTIDILGPLIAKLTALTARTPLSQPGRLHLLDETYFRRVEAIDFAIRFDDGKNPDGIWQADIVLTGISRTSKTPNCMYLAQHYGLKAANVPLISGVEPSSYLFQIAADKIIGLTIDPYLLAEIRSTRAQNLGISRASGYADIEKIKDEVNQAQSIFRKLACQVIDVSSKAIEETSSEIHWHIRQEAKLVK